MRLILVLLFAGPAFAHAGGFFRPAFSYTIDHDKSASSDTTETRRMIDFGGGYISEKGLTILGQYSLEKKKTETSTPTGSTTTDADRTSLGVGAGWTSLRDVGPYLHGIYYLQSEDVVSGTTYKGDGYEADLGLKVAIRKVSIAFQLTYRHFKYTKSTAGSTTTTLTQPREQTNLDPTIALFLEF